MTDRIGPYRLEGILGQGGMGTVYRAVDERLGRPLALKVIRLDGAGAAQVSLATLRKEAQLAAALSHANLVTIFSFEEIAGQAIISMELAPGQPLSTRLGTPWPWRSVARVLLGVTRGVGAAHQAGIAHLDLKPANVMVTDGGDVKVLDFGIARPVREQSSHGMPALGTPGYMAPEQLRGGEIGPWSDVFAVGALGYELLTGTRAFGRGDASEVAQRVLSTDPVGLETVERARERLGPLGPILRRALQKTSRERYRDASALGGALEAMLEGAYDSGWIYQPTGATPEPAAAASQAAHVESPARRRRLAVAALGAVALLIVSAGLNAFLSSQGKPGADAGLGRPGTDMTVGLATSGSQTSGSPETPSLPPPNPPVPTPAPAPAPAPTTPPTNSTVPARNEAVAQNTLPPAPAAPRATRILGQVISADGVGELAEISVVGTSMTASTGPDGRFELGRVPVGSYELRISLREPMGRSDATSTVRVQAVADQDNIISHRVSARPPRYGGIVGETGGPASVLLVETQTLVRTDNSGRFTISQVPPGRVELAITWDGDGTRYGGRFVNVTAGVVSSFQAERPQPARVAPPPPPPPPPPPAPVARLTAPALESHLRASFDGMLAHTNSEDFNRFMREYKPSNVTLREVGRASVSTTGTYGTAELVVEFRYRTATSTTTTKAGRFTITAVATGNAWRIESVTLMEKFW